jgi:hypothetical protein
MIGPHDVVEFKIGSRETLLNPFGIRTVNKTFSTVTHWADFSTSIAPDTTAGFPLKIFPTFFRGLLFKLPDIRMSLYQREFFYSISHHDIGTGWVSMGTGLAG